MNEKAKSEFKLIKADFKVGKDMLYLIADSIEYDRSYRKLFKLRME